MTRDARSRNERRAQPSIYPELVSAIVDYPLRLRWTCIRCANSCRDVPGHKRNILLTKRDVRRIVEVTGYSQSEFSTAVTNSMPYERRMKMIGGRCVFLEGLECSIYRARPLICRFYPFSLGPSERGGFTVAFDPACSGIGKGTERSRKFFMSLAGHAKRELLEC